MPNQAQLRQQITEKIIDALERDLVPWRRPWSLSKNAGRHHNVQSQNAYSGVNPLLLELHAIEHGLQSTCWGTFQQWKKLGGMVQKRPRHVPSGEWGCKIVFYKPVTKSIENDETGEKNEKRYSILRSYTVFNAEQVEGVPQPELNDQPTEEFPDFRSAAELIEATEADIRHGGNRAFYCRPIPEEAWPKHTGGDYICVPHRRKFISVTDYYCILLHELAHWSEVRLGWTGHSYALGELVAEMASCYLASELGIPQSDDLENHAQYVKSWLKAMKEDHRYIFQASTQASKVTDFLLSFVRTNQEQPEPAGIETAA